MKSHNKVMELISILFVMFIVRKLISTCKYQVQIALIKYMYSIYHNIYSYCIFF